MKEDELAIYASVAMTSERLTFVIETLNERRVAASAVVFLSYGRGLDHFTASELLPLLSELASNHGAEGLWAAPEVISMYQHGRAGLDATLANFIEEQLVSPKLLESVSRLRTDGHLFESLVELVHKHGRLNDAFALRLSQQIARLCATTNHEAFFALDEPVRKTIGLLVANTPLPLWTTLGRFYEVATPRERHWLEILVGPNRHDFDGLGHNGAGRLFWIDEELLVSWAKHDPGNRAPFLCTFYPVLLLQENGPATWNPALERIAMEFGRATEFQDALARRLYPSSWSGSIVPLLEVYLEPLTSWFNHPIGELSLWARKTHRNLQKQIAWERKRDQEE